MIAYARRLEHGRVLDLSNRVWASQIRATWRPTPASCCTQVVLVEFCIAADDLKQAVAAGRRFGLLEDTFPTLERAYKSRTIGKLVAKRQWTVAAAVAGEDPQLQVQKT
jgi:hypothetical protein